MDTGVDTTPRIDFSDLGSGVPALLYLPGWCGDRTVFEPLVTRTAEAHRSVALDWRGHGGSERPPEDFGRAQLVEDAQQVIEATGVETIVPVSLSHAGWVAIELRRLLGPARVPGIVLLDWMVLGPPPPFLGALQGLQDARAWRNVRSGLFAMWTSGLDIPDLHSYVNSMGEYGYDMWSRAAREISASFSAEGSPVKALEALDVPCPTLHLYAQPAAPEYLQGQQAYAAEHPWFQVQRLQARSHFPMFEVPDQMAAAITDFAGALRTGPRS